MLKEKKLFKYISLIIDLLNRKATYNDIVIKKQSELEQLGIENKQPMPVYPKVQYKFYVRKFLLKIFICFAILGIIYLVLEDLFPLYRYRWIDKLLNTIAGIIEIVIVTFFISKEVTKEKRAKRYADTTYNNALNGVLEHNRKDDLRVNDEKKQAIKIEEEIKQYQKKYNFVEETITKACKYGDLSKEYLSIETLTVFLEYLKDGRCETIYECMLKYDEAMRLKEIRDDIEEIENQIEAFEDAFTEASRQVRLHLRRRKEAVESLCRQQANSLDDIEYNQETTNKSLMLLSLFD